MLLQKDENADQTDQKKWKKRPVKKRVLSAIKELNYVPNVAGKRLSKNKSNVIAVLVPVINHPFFSKLIAELEIAADLRGYSLLVASSQHRIEKENEILRRVAQNEADGAIFVTHYQHNEEEFKNLAVVSIDRHLGKDIPIVTSNNYEASKAAVEYLIQKYLYPPILHELQEVYF